MAQVVRNTCCCCREQKFGSSTRVGKPGNHCTSSSRGPDVLLWPLQVATHSHTHENKKTGIKEPEITWVINDGRCRSSEFEGHEGNNVTHNLLSANRFRRCRKIHTCPPMLPRVDSQQFIIYKISMAGQGPFLTEGVFMF